MEDRHLIPLPVTRVEASPDCAWSEVSAAIAFVAGGGATRVTIANIDVTDELAGSAAALAQQARVAFALDRDPVTGHRALRVGPRL